MLVSRSSAVRLFSILLLPRFLAVFFPLCLLTGAVVLALYYQDLANEQRLHEQAGSYQVNLQANLIDQELRTAESDLLYLASQAALQSYLRGVSGSRQALEDDYLLFCERRGVYDQIRYLDAAGREQIRVNYHSGRPRAVPESELQDKSDRYYFQRTRHLQRGQVFISPFDLNVERGEIERPLKPTIRLATPVFEKSSLRGIVVLNYLGDSLFSKLEEVSRTFHGSIMLLNQEGYFLRGPAREDEWGFVLGHRRSFATHFPEAWERQVQLSQFQTRHGLFTFRTLAPLDQLPAAQQPPHEAGRPDPDAGDPTLKVAALIPADVLGRRSTQLLQRLLLLYGVVVLVVLALAWYLAYAGTLRRQHAQELASSEGRLRTLSAKLLTTQEEERRSLARDVHDDLGQIVTAVRLDLERASQAAEPQRKEELVQRALRGTASLLDHIHEISARIRPALLDDLGLKDAVQSLLGDFERRTGIVPKAELRFERQDVPRVISDNIYRILQEALTNVSRHAQAREVAVTLQVDGRSLTLKVRDPGVGFSLAQLDGKRLGLLGMRERTELLHGDFAVESAPGAGTEVRVAIPMGMTDDE
jgi:signal transduction histidine kinase